MDLFDLVATLTLDTSQYEKGLDDSESKGSKFGVGLAKAGKVAVAAVGAASVAVGAFTKKSVEAYANYEQLSGGVKKLYGDASDELMKYANNAYATAGMSANKYMEQATQFSAALINSLDGDTSKAAKQTDVAMKAISDNFNTFGGDIQNVQNAFSGFAKGQFNMLDNLKLGYGGTRGEMQRLIDDANEYAAANGMAADLTIDSFSDIVTAIDLVQQKQGIAGTTAKEAATTIEGSLNMTKAAWENLVAGLANPDADIGQLMDNLIVAIVGDKEGTGLLNQLIPAVQRAVEGIGQFLQAAVPMLAQQLPALIQSFLPVVIQSIVTLVTSIAQALPSIITTLADMLPEIVDMLINGLVDAISAAIPILVKQAPRIIKALATGLLSAAGTLVSAAGKLITSLSNALKSGLSSVASKVVSLAKKIPEKIKSGLGNLKSVGLNLIEGLWGGIKSRFDSVIGRVKALAARLPSAVKKVLGISSPSKVFMELGKWIPEGLALGIEKNMSAVYDARDAMVGATTFTPSTPTMETGGGNGDIIVNLNYDADADANDMIRDLARGVQRYRMAGAI